MHKPFSWLCKPLRYDGDLLMILDRCALSQKLPSYGNTLLRGVPGLTDTTPAVAYNLGSPARRGVDDFTSPRRILNLGGGIRKSSKKERKPDVTSHRRITCYDIASLTGQVLRSLLRPV